MKAIYQTSDYTDALIKRGILEQAGFIVYVENLHSGSSMPEIGFSLGYTIHVPGSDVEAAKAILSEQVQSTAIDADANEYASSMDDGNIDTCPACGSYDVVRYRSILWLPLLWVFNILFPASGGRYRKCINCDHKYTTEKPDLSWPLKTLMILMIVYFTLVLVKTGFS